MAHPVFMNCFYSYLRRILSNTPANDMVLILVDFNAGVGRDSLAWKWVLGIYGVGACICHRRLIEFSTDCELVYTNTVFQPKGRLNATWMQPRSKHFHFPDYLCIFHLRQRDVKDVLHTRIMPIAECGTDNRHVRWKLKLQIKPKLRKKAFYQFYEKAQCLLPVPGCCYSNVPGRLIEKANYDSLQWRTHPRNLVGYSEVSHPDSICWLSWVHKEERQGLVLQNLRSDSGLSIREVGSISMSPCTINLSRKEIYLSSRFYRSTAWIQRNTEQLVEAPGVENPVMDWCLRKWRSQWGCEGNSWTNSSASYSLAQCWLVENHLSKFFQPGSLTCALSEHLQC